MDDKIKEEIISIYKNYPFMVPCSEYKKWEGVLYIKNYRCHLLINTPYYPSLKDCSIFGSHPFGFNNFIKDANVIEDCLFKLIQKLESLLISDESNRKSVEDDSPDLAYLRSLVQIVKDIEQFVGRENVDSVDTSTSWIRLKYKDQVGYDNFIKVRLDKKYPEAFLRVIDIDLPEDVCTQFGQIRRLGDLYGCFKEVVESLLPFWKMTSDLATEAWIIEPLEPTRKDVHRRIFLSDNLSVQLMFNPLNLNSMPDIKFLGSLGAVSQARDSYQRNLQEMGWWNESSVAMNLCNLLNLDALPVKLHSERSQTTSAMEEDSNDCAICYEISIEGETFPAKWCSNKNCSGRFHHACLIEWLNSVATSKTSFDHISGPCPHCDEKIFCPIQLQ